MIGILYVVGAVITSTLVYGYLKVTKQKERQAGDNMFVAMMIGMFWGILVPLFLGTAVVAVPCILAILLFEYFWNKKNG